MSMEALLAVPNLCHGVSLAKTRPRSTAIAFTLALLLALSVRYQQENEVLMPEHKRFCFAKAKRAIGRGSIPPLWNKLQTAVWFIQRRGRGGCAEALFQGVLAFI